MPVDAGAGIRGYILTRSWQDAENGSRLQIWAATESGPAEIIINGIEPVMFVRASAAADARRLLAGTARMRDVALKALDGEPVCAIYFQSMRALERCRDRLLQRGVECLEADIQPAERFLMERFIRGSFRATGTVSRSNGFITLRDPRLRHDDYRPTLGVMSFDIETSGDASQIYSIAYICGNTSRVLLRSETRHAADGDEFEIASCGSERALLARFIEDVHELDPDVLIGWNVINFDLSVIERRCRELDLDPALGRCRANARIIPRRGGTLNAIARVPGRVVLDGIECLRSAFWVFESYSLEAVAQELLGRGKTISASDEKSAEITRLFQEDKAALARYNISDCRLVLDIFAKTDLLEFVLERTRLTGLSMGRQGGSVAAFDYLYLPRLHRRGWVAPSLARGADTAASPGGYVLDSVPGIHENVAVMDFKSLYPSIIRTFRIDPLGLAQPGDDPVPGFLGAAFSRSGSILPSIIEELWQRRDAARREGNRPLSQAIKILMNSFYGVLGTAGCRFHDPRLASSITRRGHEIIRTSRRWIEEQGFQVIYGDTDSLFVLLKADAGPLEDQARELVADLNRRWTAQIEQEYRLQSCLEIELETLFAKFFMPRVRGRETGSKKRYAGLTAGEQQTLVIKGLEAVRSDWTELARSFQRELLQAVFRDGDVEAVIRRHLELLRSPQARSKLVYRKRLRQPISAYRRNVPPHARAARLLDKPGSEVRYFMTVAGPQPVEKCTDAVDYDHYVERQIKPVADSILPFVGLDFDSLAGGQGDFFQ
ncbi:MAG TPA: DNA polymerase II [Arenicellales bacterium]|nr:DNA polymerase II [Arenicellales bacterium]